MKTQLGLVATAILLAACSNGGKSRNNVTPPPPSGSTPAPAPAPNPPPPPPADTTAPQTSIDGSPAGTIYTRNATITFSADETDVVFEGRLGNDAFAEVTSPVTLGGLADGNYSYEVRARDAAGNVDATPASVAWAVFANAPETTLDSQPAAVTNASSATFEFSTDKSDTTFEVSVDGADFAAAQSPLQLNGLAAGAHTFAVRAVDATGQADATPATHDWVIDATPPTAAIHFPTPFSYTDATVLTVRGSASDANGVASVSVNGVAATSIDGYQNWRANLPLSAVNTAITVSVTDAAGNTTASADTATVVNRGPALVGYVGLAFDPTGNQLVAIDGLANEVYGYDVTTGIGRLISGAYAPGTAAPPYAPTYLQVDATRNRAVYYDLQLDSLLAVDLADGERTVLSGPAVPGDTSPMFATNLALDPANDRAFAYNGLCDCIVGINMATGARSVVASDTQGAGAFPSGLNGLVYDAVTTPGSPRLLTSSFVNAGIFDIVAIDVATGDRSVLSSADQAIGVGPALEGTVALTLDPVRSRLLVTDSVVNGIFSVDLDNGDRALLMDGGTGTGPAMTPSFGAAYDPASNRLFNQQAIDDEIIAVDLGTLARTELVSPDHGSGAEPTTTEALVIEQPTGAATSLIYASRTPYGLVRLDLATGARTVVADDTTGTGPAFNGLTDLVLDTRPSAGPNKALGLVGSPHFQLMSFDLVTGDRTVVADLNSAMPAVADPRYLRLDVANNRVLFTNNDSLLNEDALYAIELNDGARSPISSSTRGAGPVVIDFGDFVFDDPANPVSALVADGLYLRVVDLDSGDRTTLSGPLLDYRPGLLHNDVAGSRLIGMNAGLPARLFSVTLPGAAHTLLSGASPAGDSRKGQGPLVFLPSGMAVDTPSGVVYLSDPTSGSVLAVDLVSGDRVVVGN